MELALLALLFFGAIFAWLKWSKQDEDHEAEIADYKKWILVLKGDVLKEDQRYSALERGYDETQEGLEQVILDHQDKINALLDENIKLRAEIKKINLTKNTR